MSDYIGRMTVFTGTCGRLAMAGQPDVDWVPYMMVNSGPTFPLTTQYLFGFSVEHPGQETAEVLKSSETVLHNWRLALTWLLREIGGGCK
jgi:hypothetical protein